MKRFAGDIDGQGAQPAAKRSTPPPPKTKFAFKALVPDKLAISLLGTKGANKDFIQQETGTKLVFSNKGDYFPNSRFRTLGIYADVMPNIPKCLERIIAKTVECGAEELKRPKTQPYEYAGDAPGDVMFRCTVSETTSKRVIGPAGSTIQKLRTATGAKIFMDVRPLCGHHLMRIEGKPETVLEALRQLHAIVQQGSGTQEFADWSQVVNFTSVPQGRPPAPAGFVKQEAKHEDIRDFGGAMPAAPAHPLGAASSSLLAQRADLLADAVGRMPPGKASMQYSVMCALPTAHIDEIAAYVAVVEEATGASLEVDPPPEDWPSGQPPPSTRPVAVAGPLLDIYAAHMMLMQRLKELEHAEAARRQQEEAEQAAEQVKLEEEAYTTLEERQVPNGFQPRVVPGLAAPVPIETRPARPQPDEGHRVDEGRGRAEDPAAKAEAAALKAQLEQLQAQLAKVEAKKAAEGRGGGNGERPGAGARGARPGFAR